MDYLPIVSVIFSILSLILMLILWKRLEKSTISTLDIINSELLKGLEQVYEDISPVINASSRAMGAISSLSDDTKQDKALERRLGQDLLSQNEDVLEVIRIAFPRVSEYIDEHPEAVTKLMPRLNALISDPEARKRLNLGQFGSTDLKEFWNR